MKRSKVYDLELSVNRCNWDLHGEGESLTRLITKSKHWEDQEIQEIITRMEALLKEKQGYVEQLVKLSPTK